MSKPRTRAWRTWRAGLDIKDDGGRRMSKDGDNPKPYGSKRERIADAIQRRIERNRQAVFAESFL